MIKHSARLAVFLMLFSLQTYFVSVKYNLHNMFIDYVLAKYNPRRILKNWLSAKLNLP